MNDWAVIVYLPAAKNATFANIYRIYTVVKAIVAYILSDRTGFCQELSQPSPITTTSCSYLDLVGDVKGVVITSIREDDTVQGNGHAIS